MPGSGSRMQLKGSFSWGLTRINVHGCYEIGCARVRAWLMTTHFGHSRRVDTLRLSAEWVAEVGRLSATHFDLDGVSPFLKRLNL